jgi:hypothetical protein
VSLFFVVQMKQNQISKEDAIPVSIVMLGASGAVGQMVLEALLAENREVDILTLGRKYVSVPPDERLLQEIVDVTDPQTYQEYLVGKQVAICTFGVGQPSKISQTEFLKFDKDVVIDFATACKKAGVKHFQLLGSVGANHRSRSFYLRTKGELQNALIELKFERLSIFQPSMILTPTNRYGFLQGLTLAVWPMLNFLLLGSLRQFRGVKVKTLGLAIAHNIFTKGKSVEFLTWLDFNAMLNE